MICLPGAFRLSPSSEVYHCKITMRYIKKEMKTVKWAKILGKQIMLFSGPCYLARCDLITERVCEIHRLRDKHRVQTWKELILLICTPKPTPMLMQNVIFSMNAKDINQVSQWRIYASLTKINISVQEAVFLTLTIVLGKQENIFGQWPMKTINHFW